MKFEDIEEGMQLRDHLGNEYEVVEVEEEPDSFPVQLRCTKFVLPVQVDADIVFDSVGTTWWVGCNRQYMLDASDSTVQQMLRALGINSEYVRTKTIQVRTPSGGLQDFYVYPKSRYAEFELTCDELSPIAVPEPDAVLSVDSLKLGMKLQHADGSYIVIGFNQHYVYLGSVVDATTCDGAEHVAAMCTQIPVAATAGQLSLKDFKVVE